MALQAAVQKEEAAKSLTGREQVTRRCFGLTTRAEHHTRSWQ